MARQPGGRDMAVRLKTARKRTTSQQKWLERQLNDPYVTRAKVEGWKSRAAFKLIEIDERFRLLKSGQRIVDLGAAPGGWSQYAAGKSCKVAAIDILDIEPLAGVAFLKLDFTAPGAEEALKNLLGGPADGVLSDMAANTTGHKPTDHLKIVGLAEAAMAFARDVLKPGGFFLVKLFQGGETGALITEMKRDFSGVKHVKPAASRADSSELYVLATGFRGAVADETTP